MPVTRKLLDRYGVDTVRTAMMFRAAGTIL